ERLVGRSHVPASGVPLGHPLQHPTTTFLVRTPVPEHLRDPLHRYAGIRGVIHHPCPFAGGKARSVITPEWPAPCMSPNSGVHRAWHAVHAYVSAATESCA